MKKHIIAITVLSAMLALTGCGTAGDAPEQSGSEAATTQTSDQTTVASTSETSTGTTTAAATSTKEEGSEKTAVSGENSSTSQGATAQETAASGNDDADKPNAYGYYEVKNPPASGVSVAALNGVWLSADDMAQTIVVTEGSDIYHGNYTYTDGGGNSTNGEVKLEYSLTPDSTEEYWYTFYNNDGSLWQAFGVTGDIPLDDIYGGQSGFPHYTRTGSDANVGSGEGTVTGDDFVGVWGCGRCTINISPESDGYRVDITWGSSAAESSVWTYLCYYNEFANAIACSSGGVNTNVVYSEDGTHVDTVVYDDGGAEFTISNGVLTWNDYVDNCAEGMAFVK